MLKIVLSVVGVVVIIAGGVTGYYFYKQPLKEVADFAEKYETILNKSLENIEDEMATYSSFRNLFKFRSEPFVCSVTRNRVSCISERVYIGGPYTSLDAKNNVINMTFDNNVVKYTVKSNGVFEIESSRYTNAAKYDVGIDCTSTSKYTPEDGLFENSNEKCQTNFGSIVLNASADYSFKNEDIANKNIYDALLTYYNPVDFETMFDKVGDNIEVLFKSLSLTFKSSKGLFKNVVEYINTISKEAIKQDEVLKLYNELREDRLSEIKNSDSEDDEYIKDLQAQELKAFDGIMLENNKTLKLDIFSKNEPKYYTVQDLDNMDEIIKEYTITIKSEK